MAFLLLELSLGLVPLVWALLANTSCSHPLWLVWGFLAFLPILAVSFILTTLKSPGHPAPLA